MPFPVFSVRANLIRMLLVLFSALALSACDNSALKFNNTDITGANFGRNFSLLDPDGRLRSLADFRGKVVMMFLASLSAPISVRPRCRERPR